MEINEFTKALAEVMPILVSGPSGTDRRYCSTCAVYEPDDGTDFEHAGGCLVLGAREAVVDAALSDGDAPREVEALARTRPILTERDPERRGERIFECQGCGERGPFRIGYEITHWDTCVVIEARGLVRGYSEPAPDTTPPNVKALMNAPLTLVSSPSPIVRRACFVCNESAADEESFVHAEGCVVVDAQRKIENSGAMPAFPFNHALVRVPLRSIEESPFTPGLRTYECPNCDQRADADVNEEPKIIHTNLCLIASLRSGG